MGLNNRDITALKTFMYFANGSYMSHPDVVEPIKTRIKQQQFIIDLHELDLNRDNKDILIKFKNKYYNEYKSLGQLLIDLLLFDRYPTS